MINLLVNNTRTEIDSEWHQASGISISISRLSYFEIQCQELMIYKHCGSMIVSSIYCVCMRSHEFCHFLIVCPLQVPFYSLSCCFILILSSCPLMAPCSPHCADEYYIPFKILPYGAALSYSDAEESNLGFKPSSLGSYTALILLSMYPCKALCMPVMCFTATADSSRFTLQR